MEFKRKIESSQWVLIPQDYAKNIAEVFQERFKEHLHSSEVFCEGRIYHSEICLRIGYIEKDRIQSITLEASTDYDSKSNTTEKIHTLVDTLENFAESHFQKKSRTLSLEELPREWTSVDFLSSQVYIRLTTTNPKLEASADALLNETDESLVQGEESGSEELKATLSKLNL